MRVAVREHDQPGEAADMTAQRVEQIGVTVGRGPPRERIGLHEEDERAELLRPRNAEYLFKPCEIGGIARPVLRRHAFHVVIAAGHVQAGEEYVAVGPPHVLAIAGIGGIRALARERDARAAEAFVAGGEQAAQFVEARKRVVAAAPAVGPLVVAEDKNERFRGHREFGVPLLE